MKAGGGLSQQVLDEAARERIARVVAEWSPLTTAERDLLRRTLAPHPGHTADIPSADAA